MNAQKQKLSEAANDGIAKPTNIIGKTLTEEIVIAMIGPVSSGVTTTVDKIKSILESDFNYDVKPVIKISGIIKDVEQISDNSIGYNRIKIFQKAGNKIREEKGLDFLAKKAVEAIALTRKESDYHDLSSAKAKPRRVAHLIDSIKNTGELELLREVYKDNLWVLGVFAPHKVRKDRLQRNNFSATEVEEIIRIDENETFDNGQKVRKCMEKCDYFIRNDESEDKLDKKINRFLEGIFDVSVFTPTEDETGMELAYNAAGRSACLSRQVGAAIISKEGDCLGLGWNDVPRRGGGQYNVECDDQDHRCYKWRGGQIQKACHNDFKKGQLYGDIFEKLSKMELLAKTFTEKQMDGSSKEVGVTKEIVEKYLEKTEVRNIIEYSRSVHAEMSAILDVARKGTEKIVGAKLYCTTYPCHNCARHIVAAGLEKVYYVEPYPKSLALKLHSDSISDSSSDADEKVVFLQYEGVAPRHFHLLYRNQFERKNTGGVVTNKKNIAKPKKRADLETFVAKEQYVTKDIAS